MICGDYDSTNNLLTNIMNRPALGAGQVELVAMPSGFGPFGYDAVNKVATNNTTAMTNQRRANAKTLLANLDAWGDLFRAVAAVIMDGFAAQDAVVAAAASLTDLKTRWAALAATHTLAQVKTAINNKLDSGAADS